MSDLLVHVRHPYKQVRESLGGLLDEVLSLWWFPSACSVAQLINWSNELYRDGLQPQKSRSRSTTSNPLSVPTAPFDYNDFGGGLQHLLHSMKEWKAVERDSNLGDSDYGNASKTGLFDLI